MKMGEKVNIAIVSSNFWPEITDSLEKNCLAEFDRNNVQRNQISIFRVPGSLEIPLAVKKLAKKNIYDAIIVFGAIHKGKTYHFELIANECARGCMNISLEYEIPVIFEVLAVYDIKDAIDRATKEKGNKGVEAALSALKMIDVLKNL